MSSSTASSLPEKGVFQAVISSNRQIGERIYKLKLEFSGPGALAFEKFKPGQFVQLNLSDTALPPTKSIPEDLTDSSRRQILLRRPFSFTDVTVQKDKTIAELLYRVVGPATLRMTTLSAGNTISIIGPLGNGFWILQGKKTALLVIGGMGAPPIQFLAKHLTVNFPKIDVIAFAGAKTAKELPFEGKLDKISQQLGFSLPEFAKYGINSIVATDDGSVGYEGFVTDCLENWLNENSGLDRNKTIIYSCGPEEMLAKLAEIANKRKIDCQVSMERMMACGFGVCQSCAVLCRADGTNETVYKLCCEDGPVFDSKEVVFRS